MANLYPLLLGEDPDAEAYAQALARAMQGQRSLGMTFQATGDKVLSPVGRGMVGDAGETERAAAELGGQRQARLLTRQQLAQRAREAEVEAGRWQREQTERERSNRSSEGLRRAALDQDAWAIVADPVMGGLVRYNKKTGETAPARPGVASPPAPGTSPAPGAGDAPALEDGPAGVKLTDAQGKAFSAVSRIREARRMMDEAGYPSGLGGRKDAWATGASGGALGAITPQEAASEPGQRYFTAGRNLIAALLRKESGAAITKEEWGELGPLYIPMPWDDDATRSNKLRMLDVMEDSALVESGPAGAERLGPSRRAKQAPNAAPAAPAASPQDLEAKAWAQANPSDPRAAQILERLKAKGL